FLNGQNTTFLKSYYIRFGDNSRYVNLYVCASPCHPGNSCVAPTWNDAPANFSRTRKRISVLLLAMSMTSDVVKPPLASTCDMAQLEHPPVWLGALAPMRRSTRFARLARRRAGSLAAGRGHRRLCRVTRRHIKLDKADFCLIEAGFVSIQTIRYWRQA
ncbi:hypothetical protein, partial [Burkholderia ubonensis]|uniref:hypothetical protein n=1 Tax=Burkholderia ubonensis TaxID=101571 RepID=UPI001E5168B2